VCALACLIVANLDEKLRQRFEQKVIAEAAIKLMRIEIDLGAVLAAIRVYFDPSVPHLTDAQHLALMKKGPYDEPRNEEEWVSDDEEGVAEETQYLSGYCYDPNNNLGDDQEERVVSANVDDAFAKVRGEAQRIGFWLVASKPPNSLPLPRVEVWRDLECPHQVSKVGYRKGHGKDKENEDLSSIKMRREQIKAVGKNVHCRENQVEKDRHGTLREANAK